MSEVFASLGVDELLVEIARERRLRSDLIQAFCQDMKDLREDRDRLAKEVEKWKAAAATSLDILDGIRRAAP